MNKKGRFKKLINGREDWIGEWAKAFIIDVIQSIQTIKWLLKF